MGKIMTFVAGSVVGAVVACVSCAQPPVYSQGPPPHPEIAQAMSQLQSARYTLIHYAANDFQGHKSNAIGYISNALGELQICMQMP